MAAEPARGRPAPPVRRAAVLWRRRWLPAWLALHGNLRGTLWILLSCLLFASSSALVKLLGQRLDTFEIAFFRSVLGLLMILPFLLRAGPGIFRTPHLGLHLVRALFGVAGMVSGFYAVTHLKLADAAALGFTTPLFLIVLAAVALGETVRARRWTATLIGFAGVLIMVRPGAGVVELAALVAVFGAFCAAVVKLLIKRLTATENHLTMLAWLGLFTTAFTGLPAALAWQTPTASELLLLLALGAVSSLAQVCMIRGYGVGEASAMAPIEYGRLPFAALYGFLLFAELPDG
ncbi:MAG TPA: DMT family transporter, partial [Geminicoccaceae bacterium]|nr:DMT family transporter [Geminicoccaceae bacterium]